MGSITSKLNIKGGGSRDRIVRGTARGLGVAPEALSEPARPRLISVCPPRHGVTRFWKRVVPNVYVRAHSAYDTKNGSAARPRVDTSRCPQVVGARRRTATGTDTAAGIRLRRDALRMPCSE